MLRQNFDYKYYIVSNYGVAGLNLFKNTKDYLHFLLCLKEYNTEDKVDLRLILHLKKINNQLINDRKKTLVDIAAYCLMPTHFILILQQKKEGGIPLFMKKLGTGFAMYMNKFYKTHGHIFQGKYRAREILSKKELLFYTANAHVNPLLKKMHRLRDIQINEKNLQKILSYPWSSLSDYTQPSYSYAEMTEIKYVRPPVFKNDVNESLGTHSYVNYLANFLEIDVEKIYNLKL